MKEGDKSGKGALDSIVPVLMMNSLVLSTSSWADMPNKSSMSFNRIKMCVAEMLEDVLKQYLSLRNQSMSMSGNSEPYLPGFEFFDDVENTRYFTKKVFLKDTGVKKNNYDYFKKMVANLYKVGVAVPLKGKDGVFYIQYRSLFAGSIPNDKRVNYVLISVDKDAVNKALSNFLGYSEVYSPTIKIYSPNAHVQSMYFFLKGNAEKFNCKVSKLKKFLGIPNNSYTVMSHFKAYVLEKTRKSLKEMYDQGQSDIYFEYTICDDKVSFVRHDSPSLKKENLIEVFSHSDVQARKFIEELVRLGVGLAAARKLSKNLSDFNYGEAMSKINYLKEVSAGGNLENNGGYAYSVIDNFFKEMALKEKDVMSRTPRERWIMCLASICGEVSEEACKSLFSYIGFYSYEVNKLTVSVPNSNFVDVLENKYLKMMRDNIFKFFGRGTSLQYYILHK